MTFLCINGMQHTWRPTGRVWAMWYATSTKASSMPTNAQPGSQAVHGHGGSPVSADGPTCGDCRHWDALAQRAYSIDGQLQMQAPCNLNYPQQFTRPWRWNWERHACFVPDLRPYPKEQAA